MAKKVDKEVNEKKDNVKKIDKSTNVKKSNKKKLFSKKTIVYIEAVVYILAIIGIYDDLEIYSASTSGDLFIPSLSNKPVRSKEEPIITPIQPVRVLRFA